ncbi:MAG: PQQ-like beta-propeller repeat protein [Verrucomicrobia bacterium]|nr:PQQ-like beta-propeller repeat protein [Verrucomicrobiota bacterium]
MSPFARPIVPIALAVAAVVAGGLWLFWPGGEPCDPRVPGTDHAPADVAGGGNAVLSGKLVAGPGQPAPLDGAWPEFRGPGRTGISADPTPLARTWAAGGPRALWSVEVGEGYGGAAIAGGRVYLLDYDREQKRSALRCLSLADGREIWRYAYPLSLKRNHGMTRTVPTVAGDRVIALDSKCNVACVDAATGELRWGASLVSDYGATIPAWYAGQCPLIDGDRVILAPGGHDALLVAVDLATGKPVWKTPNPREWKMTHTSIASAEIAGRKMYVYCGTGGVIGVDAATGATLWETTDWKISIATVPSPVVLSGGRIFLSGGYNAGSVLLQIAEAGGKFTARTAYRLPPETFGATQHTPASLDAHLFGIRPNGHFVCLDEQGKLVWSSGSGGQFGLGPFLIAPGLIYALNDSGTLSLFEASTAKFNLLARAQVLTGRESWGPMALAAGRLIVRDLTKVVCLDVAAH